MITKLQLNFFSSYFCVKDLSTGAVLADSLNKSGLYEWPSLQIQTPVMNHVSTSISLSRWHRRLGHPNVRTLKTVLHDFSLPYCHSNNFSCNACYCYKSHHLSFSNYSIQTQKALQVVYSDLWGPSPVLSIDKKHYYVIYVDHFTKYM